MTINNRKEIPVQIAALQRPLIEGARGALAPFLKAVLEMFRDSSLVRLGVPGRERKNDTWWYTEGEIVSPIFLKERSVTAVDVKPPEGAGVPDRSL